MLSGCWALTFWLSQPTDVKLSYILFPRIILKVCVLGKYWTTLHPNSRFSLYKAGVWLIHVYLMRNVATIKLDFQASYSKRLAFSLIWLNENWSDHGFLKHKYGKSGAGLGFWSPSEWQIALNHAESAQELHLQLPKMEVRSLLCKTSRCDEKFGRQESRSACIHRSLLYNLTEN